jgi:hypothetical protein
MAITSIGYEGSVNEQQWGKLAPRLGVDASVGEGLNATVLTTSDRTVRIAPGYATGWGVHDVSDANIDLQAPIVGSGSRWDTVAIRRTWKVASVPGFTSLIVVQGTSAKAIAAGLNNQPGVIADQPLYLIRSTAGQAQLQEIADIRQWASPPIWRLDNTIPDPALYRYGQVVIQNVGIGSTDILIRRGTPGTESWTSLLRPKWVTVNPVSGIVAASGLTGRVTKSGGKVTLEGSFKRSSGESFAANTIYSLFTLPTGYGPDRDQQQWINSGFEGSGSGARILINAATRAVTVTAPYDTPFISIDGVTFFPAEA